MNFSKDKKPTSDILSISSVKREAGGSSLSMYNSPPDGTVEFEEFATLALERFAGTSCFLQLDKYSKHVKFAKRTVSVAVSYRSRDGIDFKMNHG